MEDRLLTEIRAIKDGLAAKHNYSLRLMLNDIKEKQKNSNRNIVNLREKKRRDKEHAD